MNIKVYEQPSFPFLLNLNVQHSSTSITVATSAPVGESEKTMTTTLDFESLKKRKDWSGFDRWSVSVDASGSHLLCNIYEKTAESKLSATEYLTQLNKFSVFQVIVRPSDTSFNDSFAYIFSVAGGTLELNAEYTLEDPLTPIGSPSVYEPIIDAECISNDDIEAVVRVSTPVGGDLTLYVKSDCGHVPRKVELVDGAGIFVFTKLGMPSGTNATIKIGTKFYSNLTTLVV